MEGLVGSAVVAGGFAIGVAADEIARRLLRFRGDCNDCNDGNGGAVWRAAVGFMTAFWFWVIFAFVPETGERVVGAALLVFCVICTATDLKCRLILNVVVFPFAALFAALRLFVHPEPFWHYALGALAGATALFVVGLAFERFGRRQGVGGGDVKMVFALGAVLGLKLVILCLFFASAAGSLYGMFRIAASGGDKFVFLPFGPFLALGALAAFVWGDALLSWYVRLWI